MIAQVTNLSSSTREVVYEFGRASLVDGWWLWALLFIGIALILLACVQFYRRDVVELARPIRWVLIGLRLTAVLGLVFFFFGLQRRTQRLDTRSSEVVVLADTSQSMSLPADSQLTSTSRTDRVQQLLGQSELLDQLALEHRVNVYSFGDQSEPNLIDVRGGELETEAEPEETVDSDRRSTMAVVGALLIAVGLLLGTASLLVGAAGGAQSVGWWVASSACALLPGIVLLGAVYCVESTRSLTAILGLESPSSEVEASAPEAPPEPPPVRVSDWSQQIAAASPQSRIGDAIRGVLSLHDPATLAGIVVATDGQNNGGVDPSAATALAKRVGVAVYPVGFGSSAAPVNVRVVDLDAPRRVYPGDSFVISAVLQGSGPRPLEVDVQLYDGLDSGSNPSEDNDGATPSMPGELVETQRVTVGNDGTLTGIRFELEPESVGRRKLGIRVLGPREDANERDDRSEARYEVVSRRLRVMLVAGGPTREYRFVRNLLYRDPSIELHTWLQTGRPGMSQDADEIVETFPATAEELFEYDAIAMFDPDWSELSLDSLELLDRWLTQQAGGLILVAGPVFHPQWPRKRTDPRVNVISGFFPISISNRSSLGSGGRQGGDNPWPIDFTPEALRAEFLWIAGTPEESFRVWDEFGGVYDYVDAKTAKPAAKIYGYFSDPTTEVGGSLPVYLASQFYGAGRVYFQGSGEMWRLRGESDAYFDSYYTKLMRWVSEGRLLRDSNRGVLLVDTPRAQVGDTIAVRAVLTDEHFEPLDVPEVPAKLLGPGGQIEDLTLTPLEGEPRAGTYGTRFVARSAGSFEIRITLGDALSEEVLQQSVQVKLPTLELERPRRNDVDLEHFASLTGGRYLPVDVAVTDDSIATTLIQWIRPQPQTTVLPGTPDADFTERLNALLMWLIATALTMEWVVRRLHRLA